MMNQQVSEVRETLTQQTHELDADVASKFNDLNKSLFNMQMKMDKDLHDLKTS